MTCVSPPTPPALLPTHGDPDDLDLDATSYVTVRELGVGLQGRVELAMDQRSQQYVAIKLPTFDTREGSDEIDLRHLDCQVQSIMQERDAMRLVHHDNVLRFLCSVPGRKHHHAYVMLVMEYASNGDLFDVISSSGAMSEEACQYYFHQLLLGIQACHAAGVIHRDVKPENILFDEHFTLKLCDFGLATILDPTQVKIQELDDVEGTQLYMAPEIGSLAPFHGPPVDMWACGVVLFIMLTGFPPFGAAEAGDDCYDSVLKGDMEQFWSSQPASIEPLSMKAMDLINGLLQADPERRLTVQEALSHPWLNTVVGLDGEAIVADMHERRRQSTELSAEDLLELQFDV